MQESTNELLKMKFETLPLDKEPIQMKSLTINRG